MKVLTYDFLNGKKASELKTMVRDTKADGRSKVTTREDMIQFLLKHQDETMPKTREDYMRRAEELITMETWGDLTIPAWINKMNVPDKKLAGDVVKDQLEWVGLELKGLMTEIIHEGMVERDLQRPSKALAGTFIVMAPGKENDFKFGLILDLVNDRKRTLPADLKAAAKEAARKKAAEEAKKAEEAGTVEEVEVEEVKTSVNPVVVRREMIRQIQFRPAQRFHFVGSSKIYFAKPVESDKEAKLWLEHKKSREEFVCKDGLIYKVTGAPELESFDPERINLVSKKKADEMIAAAKAARDARIAEREESEAAAAAVKEKARAETAAKAAEEEEKRRARMAESEKTSVPEYAQDTFRWMINTEVPVHLDEKRIFSVCNTRVLRAPVMERADAEKKVFPVLVEVDGGYELLVSGRSYGLCKNIGKNNKGHKIRRAAVAAAKKANGGRTAPPKPKP